MKQSSVVLLIINQLFNKISNNNNNNTYFQQSILDLQSAIDRIHNEEQINEHDLN